MANNNQDESVKRHPNVTARETPNNYEAESALLGGMLLDSSTAMEFLPQLDSDDFYNPSHKFIFEAMSSVFAATKPVDLVTVTEQLSANGTLGMCGGVEYVSELVNAVPSVSNSAYYYNIVRKTAKLRAMIAVAKQMADAAYALDPDDKALTMAESALYSLAETGRRGKPEPVRTFVNQALADLKERQENSDAFRGVTTGFPYLDSLLGGGFQRSDLIILAARPGQGKTSFAMNCAVNAALAAPHGKDKKRYSVAVFSLEMSGVQLAKRMLCSVGNYDMSRANRAAVTADDWSKLYRAQNKFGDAQLFIDESGDVTPAEILSKCRQLKHSHGLDFVMIDYLQLMHSGKNIDNIVREIAEITRSLKLAAKELNVPILLLSQMSRDIDKRKDPTPQLSDLRDSGAIEQDADIVFFLDRSASKKPEADDAAATSNSPQGTETVFLNVAKHRNGETGSVRLLWNPATVTFKSPDHHPEAPSAYGKQSFYDGDPAPYEPPEQSAGEAYEPAVADIDDDAVDSLSDDL